jgi:hypothetical protein
VKDTPLTITDERPPIVVIPIRDWDRLAEKAVRYALRLSSEVIAVHFTRLEGPDAEEHTGELRRWRRDVAPAVRAAGLRAPRLVQVSSPYRSMTGPLLNFIVRTQERHPRRVISVVIPALAKAHWWDYVLHTHRVRRLESVLLHEGGPDLAVVNVPWTLEEPQPEAVIAAEAPTKKQRPSSASRPVRQR